jgi:hypothetical protein
MRIALPPTLGAARGGDSGRSLGGLGLAARPRRAWGLGHNKLFLSI